MTLSVFLLGHLKGTVAALYQSSKILVTLVNLVKRDVLRRGPTELALNFALGLVDGQIVNVQHASTPGEILALDSIVTTLKLVLCHFPIGENLRAGLKPAADLHHVQSLFGFLVRRLQIQLGAAKRTHTVGRVYLPLPVVCDAQLTEGTVARHAVERV